MKKTIDEIVNNLKKEGASFHKKLGVESVGFGQTQPTENGVYTPIVRGVTRYDEIKDRHEWSWGDIYKSEMIMYKCTEDGILKIEGDDYNG